LRQQIAAFHEGLKESGYVEGQNVAVEYRWAEGAYDRLPALATDLVRRQVAVIVAGGPPAARAAKAATSTIPIVFTSGDDPVQIGLVPRLNQPGGNVTGVYLFFGELSAKRLGLLHDLLPQVSLIGVLLNPTSPSAGAQVTDLQKAARALGLQVEIIKAVRVQETEGAFEEFGRKQVGAVIIGSDPSYFARRDQIVGLAARYSLPAMYEERGYVEAGGLMSYGTSTKNAYRLAGVYVGRILKGEKPADLPVLQATKFELVFNVKTATTLGIAISDNLLSIADEHRRGRRVRSEAHQ
jgi:putative tryptophan/tyrosine transport system substrate-binding protein